jgi:hypothetical protein
MVTNGSEAQASKGQSAEVYQWPGRPSPAQITWLKRGLKQPGGKLPLFDREGQKVDTRTVQTCIDHGWAEPWFRNPLKPDWLVCKLTDKGRRVAGES